jgi:hypothetical protein
MRFVIFAVLLLPIRLALFGALDVMMRHDFRSLDLASLSLACTFVLTLIAVDWKFRSLEATTVAGVILGKGKKLFPEAPDLRSWENLELMVEKTLLLLLFLFAIPAADCSAQTAPPPFDEHAFDRVPPTVVKRLATRFSLGAFAGRLEETPLDAVREAVGEGTIQHQGDAGGSIYWLCYRHAQHRLWLSSGDIGGPNHLVTELVEELTEKDTETSADCAILPEKFSPFVVDGKLQWVCRARKSLRRWDGRQSRKLLGWCILTTESSQTVSTRPDG